MALSPEMNIPESEEMTVSELLELKTFRFDFTTKRLTNELISGLDAVKQFILMQLHIQRYAHAIYSSDTGNELYDLIADESVSAAYKAVEVERLVTEALIYDVRIESVYNFEVEQIDDAFHIAFKVETVLGILEFEEVLVA